MPIIQTRRRFLTTLSLAGVAGVVRPPRVMAADGALETTAVRLGKGSLCGAPPRSAIPICRRRPLTLRKP